MPAPTLNPSLTFYGVVGSPLSITPNLTFGAPVTWSATGLPAGLSINATTGLISGTPTAATNNLKAPITVTNADGTDTVQALFIVEWPNPISVVKLRKDEFSTTSPNNDVVLSGGYHLYARFTKKGKIPAGIKWEGTGQGLRFYGTPAESGTFIADFEGPYPPNFTSSTTVGGSEGDPIDCFNTFTLASGATTEIAVSRFQVKFIVTELGAPNVTIDGFQFFGWRDFGQVYASLMRGPFMARRSGWGSTKRIVTSLVKKVATSSTSAIAPVRTGLVVGDVGNLMWSSSSPRAATITTPITLPVAGGLRSKQITQLAASGYTVTQYAIASCSDGTLAAWGNPYGQLNAIEPYNFDPNGLLRGKIVTEIQAYHDYALVLCSDGSLFKCGSGLNSADKHDSTTAVELLIGNIRVFAYNTSEDVLVYITTGGLVGYKAPPSDGTTTDTVIESGQSLLAGKTVTKLGYGHNNISNSMIRGVYALCSDGTIFFCSTERDHTTSTRTYRWSTVANSGALTGKTPVKMFALCSSSPALIFILCSDGSIAVRGQASSGAAGTGVQNFANWTTWTDVPLVGALSGKTVTSIAAGNNHTLFLTSDGLVCGVGINDNGELGISVSANQIVPVAVSTAGVLSGKVVKQIAANANASYAITTTGEAYSWGSNDCGQLGTGIAVNSNANLPAQVADGTGFNLVTIMPEVPSVVQNYELTADDIEAGDWQITEATNYYTDEKRLNIGSAQRQDVIPESSLSYAVFTGRPIDGKQYKVVTVADIPLSSNSNSFGDFIPNDPFSGDIEILFWTSLDGKFSTVPLASFGLKVFTQVMTREVADYRQAVPSSTLFYDASLSNRSLNGGLLKTTLSNPAIKHGVYNLVCGPLQAGKAMAHLTILIKSY